MVRSDRYRWYELDRAKRTAKANRNSIKMVNDCVNFGGHLEVAAVRVRPASENQREAGSSRNHITRPSTG